ncbi:MAG: DUF5103 domain-containing protein [Flavobacteriales bacterium]
MLLKNILLAVFVLCSLLASAQFSVDEASQQDYYKGSFLRLDNHNYRDNVRTVLLYPRGWPLSAPIIELNDDNPLELHFDVLDSTLGNYMYSIIHCDHNWEQSELDIQEYLDGPPEYYLNGYAYSRNTYQRYIHYSLEIPNITMRLTKSGNYVIRVYEEGDPDNLILTRRFCVSESKFTVETKVHQATRVKERYTHQEVDFTIKTGDYPLTNPYTDLKVVIIQNHTWETALTGLQPRFVKGTELDYNYDGENAFEGLNEFRFLDIKDTRFAGQGVEKVTYANRENHAYKEQDKSRAAVTYLQRIDINGWYYVKRDLVGAEAHMDADYVHVHFRLKQDYAHPDGDIYVYGALTDWQIKPEAKMSFSQSDLEYQANLYLKQGLYNYCYAYVQDGQIRPDLTRFEGSHYETENEYTILVYHRPFGWDYDKLLGVGEFKYSNN